MLRTIAIRRWFCAPALLAAAACHCESAPADAPPAPFAPGGSVRAIRPRAAMQPVPLSRPLSQIPISLRNEVSSSHRPATKSGSNGAAAATTIPPHRRPLVLEPPKAGASATGRSNAASQALYRGIPQHRRPLGW